MRIEDVMSSPVVTVTPDTTIKQAAALLVQRGFNALPVVDGTKLVGIVTEADLVPLESRPDPRSHILPLPADRAPVPHIVTEVMTRKVITLPPEEDAARAAHLMLRRSLRSIPVTAGGQVVGMVTRRDLLRVLARHDDEIRRELVTLLADELPDACVTVTVADGIVTLGFRSWLGPRDRRIAELLASTVPGVLSVRSA
jgi:CBS domain-containing protein